MSLSIRAITKTVRKDSTNPSNITHFSGNALELTLVLPDGETFDGAEKVWLEIHDSKTSDPDDVLTDLEVLTPTGGEVELNLTSGHMNVGFDGPLGQFWIVVFVTWAGESPERTEVIWTANLILQRHNASMTSPAPPAPVLRLTQTNADARYALLTSLATLAGRVTALEGAGSTGAVRYDAAQSLTDPQKTQARANVGAVIGTDVQAYSAKLAAIAALTWLADRIIYLTGSGSAAVATLTTLARNLLALNTAEAMRNHLELPANTLGLQASGSLVLEGGSAQTPVLNVTGAEFTEEEAEVSAMTFAQAFNNLNEACHLLTLAATSSSSPISGSSVLRFLSQDVEQFALNFDGSPRIAAGRQASWRTQLGLGSLATVTATLGYFATGTDAANLTGNVAVSRIANALLAPGPIGATTPSSATFTGMVITTGGAQINGASYVSGVFEATLMRAGYYIQANTVIGFGINGIFSTAFGEASPGLAEVNDGTPGVLRDLRVRTLRQAPPSSVAPTANGELVFEATSNTSVTVKLKGSDGTVRTAVLTLS